MSNLKEIVEGAIDDIAQETIDENSYYNITMADGGITNSQMASAILHPEFFNVGDVYQCVDSGTYTENHFYKFTGSAWVDTTPVVEPDYETYTISSWSALSSSEPFTFSATVTATYTIGNDTEIELINDNAVLFANYGFAIGSVSGQDVTIYAIDEPSSDVSLTIGYRG